MENKKNRTSNPLAAALRRSLRLPATWGKEPRCENKKKHRLEAAGALGARGFLKDSVAGSSSRLANLGRVRKDCWLNPPPPLGVPGLEVGPTRVQLGVETETAKMSLKLPIMQKEIDYTTPNLPWPGLFRHINSPLLAHFRTPESQESGTVHPHLGQLQKKKNCQWGGEVRAGKKLLGC